MESGELLGSHSRWPGVTGLPPSMAPPGGPPLRSKREATRAPELLGGPQRPLSEPPDPGRLEWCGSCTGATWGQCSLTPTARL